MNLKDKDILMPLAEEIRDEFKIGANTAMRVGTLLVALIQAMPSLDALRELFIRKDAADSTDFLLKLFKGAEFGEFIDSMVAGRGAAIDKDGNAQFESLDVRGPVRILELITNRIAAVGGDAVMTESGMIDKVNDNGDGTYTLVIRKDYDNDFHSFQDHDVLRGSINNLSKTGEVNTSFVRVTHTNTAANTITILPYPDSEVPSGNNSIPVNDMLLHRWGNAVNPERQSTWYISSIEGRIVFLDKVTKPIIEDHNYAAFWGKPIKLKVFENLPINYDQAYGWMRGLIAQDFFHLDYNGAPKKEIEDCGAWDKSRTYTDGSEPPYIQQDVWHYGCRWRCIVKSTTQEPKWNSTDWVMISGNENLLLDIYSNAGTMYRPNSVFRADLEATVFLGKQDITADIESSDWAWTRDTGNVVADNAWAVKHAGTTNQLTITQDDMEDLADYTKFICTAYVRDGKEIKKIEKEIRI